MKRNDLSTIMRRAWAIARSTGKSFSVALSRAWQLHRLTRRMRGGLVRFVYEKRDGTLRRAVGTLHDVTSTIKSTMSGTRPEDGRTVRYYDIEASGWRSFRVENFIGIC